MELLDRYLQAVKFWLPREAKSDIIAELSEGIRSQIDEQEAELGRPLTDVELESLLKRWGSPILVAERYLPQRYLIGPALFPLYLLVLKLVTFVYVLPWLLVWLFMVIFLPSYRAAYPGLALIGTLQPLLLTVVFAFTVVTLNFAFLERSGARARLAASWSLGVLPAVRDPHRISRSDALGELAGGILFILWWLDVVRLPAIPGVQIAMTPILARTFYWPILMLVLAVTAIGAVNLIRPWWTQRRTIVRLAIDGFGVVLVGFLLRGPWIVITIPGARAVPVAEIARWVNLSLLVILLSVGGSYLLSILRGIRRLVRGRTAAMAVS
jgi:hypothetical protein